MKTKLILMGVAGALLLTATIGGVVANYYGKGSTKSIITTNLVGVELQEGESADVSVTKDLTPGAEISHPIYAKNTQNSSEYLKVTVTKFWTDSEDEQTTERLDNLNSGLIGILTESTDDWIIKKGSDIDDLNDETVVMYYKKPLEAGQVTSNIVDKIKVSTEADNEYCNSIIHMDVTVDSVQSSNATKAILSEWGLDASIADDGTISEISE